MRAQWTTAAGVGNPVRALISSVGAPELGSLVFAGSIALALRLAFAVGVPDFDLDAYGHFELARAFIRDPTNLGVHWVWLPGWHVALAGGLLVGAGHTSVRVANAVLQTLGPWLLYLVARGPRGEHSSKDRSVAYTAGLFYTVAPLPNLMATSAQAETPFSLLLLGAACAFLRERPGLAGSLLGAASLVRYEAWGVVALFGLSALRDSERRRRTLTVFVVAASAIAAWLCLRRLGGLPWFSFASGTRTFVERYRDSIDQPAWLDVAALAVLPVMALGPAVLLALPGMGELKRRVVEVPAGVALFLLVSASGAALLALPRYFTALTPFVCIAMAAGAAAWCKQAGRPKETRVVGYAVVSLALLTLVHLTKELLRAQ